MRARALKVVLSVLVLSACASAGGGAGRGDPSVITREEIEAQGTQQEDAYTLIRRLRPNWLRAKGTSIGGERLYPMVLLNGTRYGPLDELRSFRTVEVESLEYISATEATTQFGTGYMGGAIMVRTR